VNVGVIGIVVIDRSPDEPTSEVFFDLPHEAAREFGQVQTVGFLRRDYETELSLLALQGCPNLLCDEVFICRIKSTGGAVAFDAVTFEIFQVFLGRFRAFRRPKLDVVRLDHAAPAARARVLYGHAAGSARLRVALARTTASGLPESACELRAKRRSRQALRAW
jgi:hypothetical protein